jgi:hypothetical protein
MLGDSGVDMALFFLYLKKRHPLKQEKEEHMNALTIRFALPALVILTIVAIAIIAFAVVAHGIGGTAYGYPW